jgi:hypothetical protein
MRDDDMAEVLHLESIINIEKKPCFISSLYAPVGGDGDLAIIKILPKYYLAEYMLNPYSQLKKLVNSWKKYHFGEKQRCFDDVDLFYLARAFVIQMSPRDSSLTLKQIEQLAGWKKLTLELGSIDNHEKLIRCIYHFFEEHQDRVKKSKEANETYEELSPEEKQNRVETMLMEARDSAYVEEVQQISQDRSVKWENFVLELGSIDNREKLNRWLLRYKEEAPKELSSEEKQKRITSEILAVVKTKLPVEIEQIFAEK